MNALDICAHAAWAAFAITVASFWMAGITLTTLSAMSWGPLSLHVLVFLLTLPEALRTWSVTMAGKFVKVRSEKKGNTRLVFTAVSFAVTAALFWMTRKSWSGMSPFRVAMHGIIFMCASNTLASSFVKRPPLHI